MHIYKPIHLKKIYSESRSKKLYLLERRSQCFQLKCATEVKALLTFCSVFV